MHKWLNLIFFQLNYIFVRVMEGFVLFLARGKRNPVASNKTLSPFLPWCLVWHSLTHSLTHSLPFLRRPSSWDQYSHFLPYIFISYFSFLWILIFIYYCGYIRLVSLQANTKLLLFLYWLVLNFRSVKWERTRNSRRWSNMCSGRTFTSTYTGVTFWWVHLIKEKLL